LILAGCSASKRFSEDIESDAITNVRLLIDESPNEKELSIKSDCFLFEEEKEIGKIFSGEKIFIKSIGNSISLKIKNNFYEADYFQLKPVDEQSYINIDKIKLRGTLKITNKSGSVILVNSIDLESYLKGVIPREIPLGNGDENIEALKAFAICARTFTLQRLNLSNTKEFFDLFIDVRDQVYGGVNVEQPVSNKAVDETRGLILTYKEKPATVYYSSTCAGMTEDAKNIFNVDEPYLKPVKDGNEPYCIISHAFEWEEFYTQEDFIERILNNTDQLFLESQKFELNDIRVLSRFESGRVNELDVELIDTNSGEVKSIIIKGNNIRWIIKRADNKGILRSIWFDIKFDENKNVTITGKGYGHGVGLCQYGAIGMNRSGKSYKEILNHYFPGTDISQIK